MTDLRLSCLWSMGFVGKTAFSEDIHELRLFCMLLISSSSEAILLKNGCLIDSTWSVASSET